MKKIILDINCTFCGKKGGELELDDYRAEYQFQIEQRNQKIEELQKPIELDLNAEEMELEIYRRGEIIKILNEDIENYSEALKSVPNPNPNHDIKNHVEDHRCEECEAKHGKFN